MSKVVSSFFKFIKLGISSFELCFPFIIDFIEYKEQYLNSRFRSETRFQSCLKKHYLFFAPQKLKKTPFKSCSENLKIPFYFLTALSCPNSPKRRINVPLWRIDQLYIELGFKVKGGSKLEFGYKIYEYSTQILRLWRNQGFRDNLNLFIKRK